MKAILYILMFVINCTWGIVQSFIGFVMFLVYIRKPHFWYKGSIVTINSIPMYIGGFSLGVFIFLSHDIEINEADKYQILRHEYGHFLQSLLLGPFCVFFGIFSVLKNKWFEGWADKWGKADRRVYKID
jgi:hypothetical protein